MGELTLNGIGLRLPAEMVVGGGNGDALGDLAQGIGLRGALM